MRYEKQLTRLVTTIEPKISAVRKPSQIVEMNWDPITRIVGSLGLYTKIDFGNRVITECHATSSIFRGYSIFMKGRTRATLISSPAASAGICGGHHAT